MIVNQHKQTTNSDHTKLINKVLKNTHQDQSAGCLILAETKAGSQSWVDIAIINISRLQLGGVLQSENNTAKEMVEPDMRELKIKGKVLNKPTGSLQFINDRW